MLPQGYSRSSYIAAALLSLSWFSCDSGERAPAPEARANTGKGGNSGNAGNSTNGGNSGVPTGKAKRSGAAERAASPPAAPQPTKPGDIEWGGNTRWVSYEAGLAEAKATGKPLCVVVYAEWCVRCRELAAVFRDPKFERLSKDFVMVRQDSDAPNTWLNQPPLAQHGSYVPRVFFFDRTGQFNAALRSKHPRFPFFYSAQQPEALEQSMLAALKPAT